MGLMVKNGKLLAHYFGGRLALTTDPDVCDCDCGGEDDRTCCQKLMDDKLDGTYRVYKVTIDGYSFAHNGVYYLRWTNIASGEICDWQNSVCEGFPIVNAAWFDAGGPSGEPMIRIDMNLSGSGPVYSWALYASDLECEAFNGPTLVPEDDRYPPPPPPPGTGTCTIEYAGYKDVKWDAGEIC